MLFDLDQLVRIDIVNPPSQHKEYLENEFHFIKPRSMLDDGRHDVRITFRDDLQMDRDRWINLGAPVGYDGAGVFWFDPNHEIARVDFENFDSGTTPIIASSKFNVHFLYILVLYMLSFKAVRNRGVFCHGAVVRYKDRNLLFPAWRHVGKTNLMLSLLEGGAELVSDDGVLLFDNGEILSYSKRMNLLYYNFKAFPHLLDRTDPEMRALMKFVEDICNGVYEMSREAAAMFQKLVRVRLHNSEITGVDHYPSREKCDLIIHLDKQLDSTRDKEMSIYPMSLEKLVTKATESTLFEMSHLLSAYQAYSLLQCRTEESLEYASEKVAGVLNQGFAKAENLYELSFNQYFDPQTAKKLVDKCIDHEG